MSAVGPIWLSSATTEELSAAVKQALDNVAQHAQATRVTLFADHDDDGVLVSVRDDGIGFVYDQALLEAEGKAGIDPQEHEESRRGAGGENDHHDLSGRRHRGRVRGSVARSRRMSGDLIRVMVVDDHPVWRDGVRADLEASGVAEIVAEAADGEEAIEAARTAMPEVVIPTGPDPREVAARRRADREEAFARAQGPGQTPEEQRQATKRALREFGPPMPR